MEKRKQYKIARKQARQVAKRRKELLVALRNPDNWSLPLSVMYGGQRIDEWFNFIRNIEI